MSNLWLSFHKNSACGKLKGCAVILNHISILNMKVIADFFADLIKRLVVISIMSSSKYPIIDLVQTIGKS